MDLWRRRKILKISRFISHDTLTNINYFWEIFLKQGEKKKKAIHFEITSFSYNAINFFLESLIN